jgi:hypothetical protein
MVFEFCDNNLFEEMQKKEKAGKNFPESEI